jgi:hypothetical protein
VADKPSEHAAFQGTFDPVSTGAGVFDENRKSCSLALITVCIKRKFGLGITGRTRSGNREDHESYEWVPSRCSIIAAYLLFAWQNNCNKLFLDVHIQMREVVQSLFAQQSLECFPFPAHSRPVELIKLHCSVDVHSI